MHAGIFDFDYVSFLIEIEQDHFQTYYLPEWMEKVANHLSLADQKRHTKVHALGAGKDGKRRYVLSVSGPHAKLAKNLPWGKWAWHLTRLDIRATLYECRPDTAERLILALEHADTRSNIEGFKTATRTKNLVRDAGGRGVRKGSRKSDVCGKLYYRGKEKPALEMQLQDDKLAATVVDADMDAEGYTKNEWPWECLRARAETACTAFFDTWLWQSHIEYPLEGLRHENIPIPPKLVALAQAQMALYEPIADDDGPADLARFDAFLDNDSR